VLYVTTRTGAETYTALQTLQRDLASDGGLFVPFRLPRIGTEALLQMKSNTVSQTVAQILNLFFPGKLTEADVDGCIGKEFVQLVAMSHKIVLAEIWHNESWDISAAADALAERIQGQPTGEGASEWAAICCRVAFLFAIYALLLSKGVVDGIRALDVAVSSYGFRTPMAVWYAREMGLPVGVVVCGCDDNGDVWDLLHRGEMRCNAASPDGLERLVYGVFGQQEAIRYGNCRNKKNVYTSPEHSDEELGQGMFAAVVSKKRMESVIRNVYRTNSYVLSPQAALAYGGLQDYRAARGESAPALILAEQGALCFAQEVASALGIPADDLKAKLR